MTKKFLAALALSLALAPVAAAADPFTVQVDQTVTLKVGGAANSVIIGNATVADVAVHDARTLLIESDSGLTIIRGQGTYSYSCSDKCRATPMVGDAPEHFSGVMSTVTGKAAAAKGE
jgi:Flp pilus assembly secretin CpaC